MIKNFPGDVVVRKIRFIDDICQTMSIRDECLDVEEDTVGVLLKEKHRLYDICPFWLVLTNQGKTQIWARYNFVRI